MVVFNLILEKLVEQFGPGSPASLDECEVDYKGECLRRILEEGKSWGAWPETPHVGEWKSTGPAPDDDAGRWKPALDLGFKERDSQSC